MVVDQQEEGLRGVELQTAPGGQEEAVRHTWAGENLLLCLPDDLDQLAHVHVIRNQELGLVQEGQLLLAAVALNDDLQTGRRRSWEERCGSGLLLRGLLSGPGLCACVCVCVCGGTYRDLVGVLFPDLLDLFAAISCGEQEVKFRRTHRTQNKPSRMTSDPTQPAPERPLSLGCLLGGHMTNPGVQSGRPGPSPSSRE